MADGKYLIGESLREKLKSTIAKVDSIPFGGPVSRIPTVIEGDGQSYAPKVFRVCTATGAWAINTDKVVTFRGVTTTPNTVSAKNEIINLPAPKIAANRLVNIAKEGTQWYLVSFQMATATAVFATATQTRTFVGTAGTQTITFLSAGGTNRITYAGAGPEVSVVTDVSAVLNTTNCSITVNKTTTSVKTVGASQTATTVSLSGTQTATIMSMSGTQTAVFLTGTFTATYVSLDI